jgi:hypothetical protein
LDFDDLLATGPAEENPFVTNGRMSVRQVSRIQRAYRDSLDLADAFTVSTDRLADLMWPILGERPMVIPNGLPRSWLSLPAALAPSWQPGDPRVLRYFSGSASHELDLETVLPVIAGFLEQNPEVRFEVVGHVEIPGGALPERRWGKRPPVAFNRLPPLLASSWATIAPLTQTSFNACKSAIKFLESAAWGAPCVATPIDDIQRCKNAGVCMASSEEEWWTHLTNLMVDDYRMEVAKRAENWVREYAHAKESAVTLLQWLNSKEFI